MCEELDVVVYTLNTLCSIVWRGAKKFSCQWLERQGVGQPRNTSHRRMMGRAISPRSMSGCVRPSDVLRNARIRQHRGSPSRLAS
jgi:hypothetical protein